MDQNDQFEKDVSDVRVALQRVENVFFRSKAQSFEINGQPVEYHLRQPGDEPALRIRGKWYVLRIREVAEAILNQCSEGLVGKEVS